MSDQSKVYGRSANFNFKALMPSKMPFIKELKNTEKERCEFTLSIFEKIFRLDKCSLLASQNALQGANVELAKVNLANDLETFEKIYLGERTTYSTVAPTHPVISLPDFSEGQPTLHATLTMIRDEAAPKSRYITFREETRTFSIFDNAESERARDVLRMEECSAHLLSETHIGQPCFQICNRSKSIALNETLVYKFASETAAEAAQWVNILQKYTYCCDTCAEVNRYNAATMENMSKTKNLPATKSSLALTVVSGMQLVLPNGSKASNCYCVILYDEVKYGKTQVKESDNPHWEESFPAMYASANIVNFARIGQNYDWLFFPVQKIKSMCI